MSKTSTAKAAAAALNYRTKRLVVLTDGFTRVACALIDGAKLVVPVYLFYLCVREVAGKSTEFNMIVKAIADLKANEAFFLLFGAGGVGWAVVERKFRKKKTAALAERAAKAEKMLDSKRSSSGLPSSGDTHRDDTP